ncbi:MAG: YncE family protein [Endozoicomonas sp.]
MKTRHRIRQLLLLGVAFVYSVASMAQPPNFIAFESASVRPMTLSGDGKKLYVTNTPDNVVEVYDIGSSGSLAHSHSIPVGMEPVALAVNGDDVWVINHLSDSVSIIDTARGAVKRTLLVGDEPRDIVFAKGKAFITTAHRGQHRAHGSLRNVQGAGDPQIHTPSVARADVWVFDASNQRRALGGKPLKIVELFGDTPRALAVSPDGNTVYAAVFNSGNQTSVVHEGVVCAGFEDIAPQYATVDGYTVRLDEPDGCYVQDGVSSPNGLANGALPANRPGPGRNADGVIQPWTSMIVKYDNASGQWKDSRGLNFSNGIRFNLPDQDVFAIDAASLNPVSDFRHVGTTLFNMAVNPVNGKIYVSNTDANNAVRFEGPGNHGGSTVQGNIAKSRITVIDPNNGAVKPRHLNKHIDYSVLKAPASVKQHTVSTPVEMQISSDGSTLYVAALGSDKIAVYNTADLEKDADWNNFDPAVGSANHISVTGGPQGILLDEQNNGDNGQLYVLTRFDNSVKVVDATTGETRQTVAMFNPEPADLQAGRFMLYDASRSSSNGESSCASCHVFGDMDHLSWNLGNPDGGNTYNSQPMPTEHFTRLDCNGANAAYNDGCFLAEILNGDGQERTLASMKGPMTTQTMRGMSTHGHMHWRGDRVTGYFGTQDADNLTDMEALDERLSFKNFIVAFEGLMGLDVELKSVDESSKPVETVALEQDMDKFADFMLQVQLPPNPIRKLNNGLSSSAQVGRAFFAGPRRSDGLERDDFFPPASREDGKTCEGCHTHDPSKGFYGSDGKAAHGGEILITKVPSFRNLYQKIGMFGLPDRNGFQISPTRQHQGDQVRGFGFLHDGATDQLFQFLQGGVFDDGTTGCPPGMSADLHGCTFNDQSGVVGIPDDQTRQGLVDYLMEFDSDLAPIVGQQITLYNGSTRGMRNRLKLLENRSGKAFVSKILGGNVTECDLVARGVVNGEQRGYLYEPSSGTYYTDKSNEAAVSKAAIRQLAESGSNALTFTCTPPGSGERIALDRDLDGVYNGDVTSI